MTNLRQLLLAAITLLCFFFAEAENRSEYVTYRPVLSAYTLDIGTAHIADTYLSPLRYNGFSTAFSYERMQAMRFNPERWIMQLHISPEFARTLNPARNSYIYDLNIHGSWAMMARFRMPATWLTLMAGGSTGADLGMLYAPRNGNNPVSAKASWTVNATAAAVARFRLGRLPIVARYQAEMALAGVFSPQVTENFIMKYRLATTANSPTEHGPAITSGLTTISQQTSFSEPHRCV